MIRFLQYLFIAIIVTTVGLTLYQWNASRASTQKTAPNNGLVGYWSFDENTGTGAGDASGNANTGTLTNGPTWTTGKLGKAINFDGVDDHTTMGDPSVLKINGAFTISAWIYPESFGGGSRGRIVDKNSGFTAGYIFYINNSSSTNAISVGVNDTFAGTSRSRHFANAVTLNNWQHVVAVFNGTNVTVYNNASAVGASQTLTVPGVGTDNFVIGGKTDANDRNFDGTIDEVRVYNRALSGTEVTNLYNLGATKLNISPTDSITSGLVGYWTFDGKDTPWTSSSAGTVTDRSGSANTGTLTNMNRTTSITEGKLGQALSFDGTDDYVTTVDSNAFSPLINNITVSFWARVPIATPAVGNDFPGNTGANMVAKGFSSQWEWTFENDNNARVYFSIYDLAGTAGNSITATRTVNDGVWHHYVGVIDYTGDLMKFYIDNTLIDTATSLVTMGNGTQPLEIGRRGDGKYFTGNVDEVRIYNRALGATEIAALYNSGR